MMWIHGHLYGNSSRYVFSTYYRLGFRLLGLSCVLVQAHHLHRPKAHLGSLCCFKALAKAEKSECYFNSPKVEAGQWVTGQSGDQISNILHSDKKIHLSGCLYRAGLLCSGTEPPISSMSLLPKALTITVAS